MKKATRNGHYLRKCRKRERISVADYTAKCVENISKVLSQTGSVLTKVFGEKDNPFSLKNERLAIR